MIDITRRGFVISAGVAAGLGLAGPLYAERAFAQSAAPAKPFHRYRVGSAEVTALWEGLWEKPHDPAYIANASLAQVKDAMTKAGFTADFVSIPHTVVCVRNAGRTILCDAGTGGQMQPTTGKLMASLAAAGIDPASIDAILVSHFHPDHIYGLMAKETNQPVFANAEIIVPDVEYRFWTDPSLVERVPEARKPVVRRIQAVFPTWKQIRQVEGEAEVAPGIRFVMAPGHTPGHRAFHLASGSEQLLISNDTAYVPALVAANPGWHGVFDMDAPTAEASRRRLLDRVVAENMAICGYHFPFPGVGRLAKDGSGYALTLAQA